MVNWAALGRLGPVASGWLCYQHVIGGRNSRVCAVSFIWSATVQFRQAVRVGIFPESAFLLQAALCAFESVQVGDGALGY